MTTSNIPTGSRRREIFEAIEHEAQFTPNAVDIRKVAEGGDFNVEEVTHVVLRIGYHWNDSNTIDTKRINA